MGILFPTSPLHGTQYSPPGIPIVWQFDSGRNAWRVVRGGPSWDEIAGKPATFPPSIHQHPIADVTGLQTILDVKQDISARGQPSGYAPLDVNGMVPEAMIPLELEGTVSWDGIEDKPAEFPPVAHSHPVAEISDSSSVGQNVVRAPTPFDARQAIGAIGADENARVTVKDTGISIGMRRAINFIEGANISMSIADDAVNEEVDVTISSSGGGGGSAITVSATKPAAPFDNDLWLDAATGILFIYYNDASTSQWIEALPFLTTMPAAFTAINFPAGPIEGQTFSPITGATWKWSATRGVWHAVTSTSDSYTKAEADTKFVDNAGDTMTGPLTLSAAPTATLQAATKGYVDSKPSLFVSDTPPPTPLDGSLWWDSDIGMLYVRYNDGTGAQWVQAVATPAIDASTFVLKSGSTMTGALSLNGDPTSLLHAVPKQYADAPVDEKSYARRGAIWSETPRYQRIPFVGITSVDVAVPAGAVLARVTGHLIPTTATGVHFHIQVSVAAGVFLAANGDYAVNGFSNSSSASGATSISQAAHPGMQILSTNSNLNSNILFDGLLKVKRHSSTDGRFVGDFRSVISTGTSFNHQFHYCNVSQTNLGTSTSLLALRFTKGAAGDVFGPDSFVALEWL